MALCSTCSCYPCGCPPCPAESQEGYCDDPGIVTSGQYASVLNDELCDRRLVPWRGLDEDGNIQTDTNEPLKPAYAVQDPVGKVRWNDQPGVVFPETNELDSISGHVDGLERSFKGPAGTVKDMRWDGTGWVLVDPPGTDDAINTCTATSATFTIDPVVDTYVVIVVSTENFVEGLSVMVGGYEFKVDEVIDATHLRLVPVETPLAVEDIESGSTLCSIGFRPCPAGEEDSPTELVFCENGRPVTITAPDDVDGKKVPFGVWRGQDGTWHTVDVPVDGDGLPEPGFVLMTPAAPVAGQPNIPSFQTYGGSSGIAISDVTGAGLSWPSLAFTLPNDYDEYVVRVDVSFNCSSISGAFYEAVMTLDGSFIRAITSPFAAKPGWGGLGFAVQANGGVDGFGFAVGTVVKGAHTLSLVDFLGSGAKTRVSVVVSWTPKA